jgi:hypothetical protein
MSAIPQGKSARATTGRLQPVGPNALALRSPAPHAA